MLRSNLDVIKDIKDFVKIINPTYSDGVDRELSGFHHGDEINLNHNLSDHKTQAGEKKCSTSYRLHPEA